MDYAITVVPIFPPLFPSTQQPHSLRQSPHHCSCPWVMCISSLAILLLPICTLFPSPLHPYLHTPFPSGNHQNPLHIHDSVSVLLAQFVFWIQLLLCIYCHFIVCTFGILFLKLSPFKISYNNGLVMMNSFSFFLVWEALYLPFHSKW